MGTITQTHHKPVGSAMPCHHLFTVSIIAIHLEERNYKSDISERLHAIRPLTEEFLLMTDSVIDGG